MNQIVAVRKSLFAGPFDRQRHQHIIAVKLANGVTLDLPRVIQQIKEGVAFYTVANGYQARVYAAACRLCRNPYITTSPDDTTANNLDNLPLF